MSDRFAVIQTNTITPYFYIQDNLSGNLISKKQDDGSYTLLKMDINDPDYALMICSSMNKEYERNPDYLPVSND